MPSLTREQIKQRTGARRYAVLPLSMGDLRIRSLTDRERNALDAVQLDDEGKVKVVEVSNRPARMIAACAVDDDGNPLYKEDEFQLVQEWDTFDLDNAFIGCRKHLGLDRTVEERLAALEKKSGPTPGGDSAST